MIGEQNIDIIHRIIETTDETMLFSVFCEGMAVTSLYLELRNSCSGDTGTLYYIIGGRNREEDSLMHTFFARRKEYANFDTALAEFDYRPFIRQIKLTKIDFERIHLLMSQNPLPDIKSNSGGKDGHTFIFSNRIRCASKYVYWVFPPKGYEHLKEVINIISRYIAEPYGRCLYL